MLVLNKIDHTLTLEAGKQVKTLLTLFEWGTVPDKFNLYYHDYENFRKENELLIGYLR